MATPPPAAPQGTSPAGPALGSTTPQSTLANEPMIDPETTRTTFPNRPMLITGLVLLGASYGASAIVAATSERAEDEKLYYPIVGPWMDLDERDCRARPCGNEDLNKGLLIGDGIVQGVGALAVVFSLFIPEKSTRRWYLIGNNDLVLAPRLTGNSTGLWATGRF